jgi:hypothetical protein
MDRVSELEHQLQVAQRRCEELEIAARQAERAAEKATIESHIRAAAVEVGIIPDAIQDVVYKALEGGQWKTNSKGRLVHYVDEQPVVDIHGDYMTPQVWLKGLRSTAAHFFSDGQVSPGAKEEVLNPWSREYWNLTKQGRIAAVSIDEARRLAEAVGSLLGATQPPTPRY